VLQAALAALAILTQFVMAIAVVIFAVQLQPALVITAK
jgi:hypothetical protein